jgi:ankyrin repeat protein
MLLKAGADIHVMTVGWQTTLLHLAATFSHADVVAALIKAGAAVNAQEDSGRTPLDWAIYHSRRRLVPILLHAGATPPAQTTNAYIQKVIAAGGFGRYQRNQLNALAATFAPHFAHLPPEIVRLVVEYAFHVGDY